MMNLKEIREAYEELSSTLSSVIRQINFAGIAIIWIFVGKEGKAIDQFLLSASLLVVISIILDVLQYLIGTVIWHIIYIYKHTKDTEDEYQKVRDREWINFITWACLYVKCIATGWGYYYILRFFIMQFHL